MSGERVDVRVVEVVEETGCGGPPEIDDRLRAAPRGGVAVQLRRTAPLVTVSAGLARRPGLIDRVRELPGRPPVATTAAGGTFVVGGPGWLSISAIGRPSRPGPLPIDWMLAAVRTWLADRLRPHGVALATGRIDGAWCPGFSDLSARGRKLVGLGFRVSREHILVRGALAVASISDADLALLDACHRLIDLSVERGACTSLAEEAGGRWDVDDAIRLLGGGPG